MTFSDILGAAPVGSHWRHEATGGEYVVTGHCRIETTLELAVPYVGQPDGLPWARGAGQFLDGRFVRIDVDAERQA